MPDKERPENLEDRIPDPGDNGAEKEVPRPHDLRRHDSEDRHHEPGVDDEGSHHLERTQQLEKSCCSSSRSSTALC